MDSRACVVSRTRFLPTRAALKRAAEATFTNVCIWAGSTAGATVPVVAVVTRLFPTLTVADLFVPSTGHALTCHTYACAVASRVVCDGKLDTTTRRVARRRGAWIVVLLASERCA